MVYLIVNYLVEFKNFYFISTPLDLTFSINLTSEGNNNNIENPPATYLAVLPTRCTYVCGSSGQSNYITQSTFGKSNPLDAILVVKSVAALFSENVKNIAVLLSYFYRPCNSKSYIPSLIFLKTSNKKRTYLQVDANTTIFCLLCVLRNEYRTSILSSICVTM